MVNTNWFDIINLTWDRIPLISSLVNIRRFVSYFTLEEIVSSCLKSINLWSYRILRFIIGGIFIYSGAVKLADVKGFARLITQYNLVHDQLLAPVAVGLPVIELLAGVGLLF